MKNVIWILIAAAVAVGVYFMFTGKSVEELAEEVSGTGVDAPEALESAADAAGAAVETTTEAATEAVDEATDVTKEVVDTATETATEASGVTTTTVTDVLSVDGFSMDKVNGMIDNSGVDDLRKAILKGALKKAQDDPETLKIALEQVKTALGM